jgi:ATP synthase F1 complex assembly factor 1
MTGVAEKYSSFVVPIPRVKDPAALQIEGEETTAYEFYFLQWGFHGVPPVPSTTQLDLFTPSTLDSNATTPSASNPQTSTILFTPLQEYKQRASFATPYLVLTHYTDFARTHGIVLLRGEITPSTVATGATGADGRYLLNQADAQLLSMGVQKFYLWGEGDGKAAEREGERLLKTFHEQPEEFKWEQLLKHASWTI